MSDFAASWKLSRQRFGAEIDGLNFEQLSWRLHDKSLTLGETAVHVAGVEIFFISQLLKTPLEGDAVRIAAAATNGVVNDKPFPVPAEELTPEFVQMALELARSMIEPVITAPTDEVRAATIQSALGPIIDGTGALARLAFHPAYHQGQAYLIRLAPGFPS